MRRARSILLATAFAVPVVGHPLAPALASGPDVVISEFMAANTNTLLLGGSAPDWIELWNRGGTLADLGGWHLTDTAANLTKWTVPAGTTLAAGARMLLYADSAPTSTPPLHTNFGLSAGGEYLGLTDTGGAIVSQYAPTFPAQTANISYGIGSNGPVGFLLSATPGAANATSATGFAAKPTISQAGGWLTGPISVALATTTPGAAIMYTTDGSTPTATHGTAYTTPLAITGTTILRAAAVVDGWFDSRIASATYLYIDDVLAQVGVPAGWPAGPVNRQVYDYGMLPTMVATDRAALEAAFAAAPTVSVTTDLANLVDPTTGIYSNPLQDGSEWERPVSLELIDPSGAPGFQINSGLRIKGSHSRDPANPKHSFRVKFGPQYDGLLANNVFGTPMHTGVTDVFTELELRSEQNWSWHEGSDRETFLRDVWSRDSQAAEGDPTTRSRWVHLFLDGQYWGLYMLKDRPAAGHAVTQWGGATADYDVIKHGDDFTYEVQDGDDTEWLTLWTAVQDGAITDDEYAAIADTVDLADLADFQLTHMVAGNHDATPDLGQSDLGANNWYAVRGNGQPFRFFVDDAEHSMGAWYRNNTIDRTGPFKVAAANSKWGVAYFNPGWLHQVLINTRAEYRTVFRSRAAVLLAPGGPLDDTAATARWATRQAEVDPLVVAEAARWGDSRGGAYTRATWLTEVNWVLTNWFPGRAAVVRHQLELDALWVAPPGAAAAVKKAVRLSLGG